MSDDTPTERFPAREPESSVPGGTEPLPASQGSTEPLGVPQPAPTEILYAPSSAAPVASSAAASPSPQPPRQSRTLLYTLVGVGAVLLIAVVIVVILLLNRGGADEPLVAPGASDTPIQSASPSAEPSEEPSAEPIPEQEPAPPVVVGPVFDSFSAPTAAGCAEGDTSKPLTFSWSSGNASAAYVGVATTNAKAEPFEGGLPVVYTYTNLSYQCSEASQVYTVTLEDADGNLAHQTVTISK